MSLSQGFLEAARMQWRFVTFRMKDDEFDEFTWKNLLLGLSITWIVGIGRNWDLAGAPLFASLGLPSLAYVFVLSAVLFIFAAPLSYVKRSYFHILTGVTMTAVPGLLYAIPVEKFMTMTQAQATNFWFLAIVATWRVALSIFFFIKSCQMTGGQAAATLLTPVTLILFGLQAFGRAGDIARIMGGIRNPSAQDDVTRVLFFLTLLAIPGFFFGLLVYLIAWVRNRAE